MTTTEEPTEPASQAPSQEASLKLNIPEENEEPTQAPTEVLHCSKCGSELTSFETPTGTRYRCAQCGGFVKPAEKVKATAEQEEEEVEAPLKPPDVEATDFVVAQLKAKLPNIYGITKKALAIAQSVEGNPQIALNPNTLFFHIKQLAPRANDYQLYLLLSGIFQKMQRERYLQTPSPFPIITPMPQRTSFPQTFPQTNQPGWNPWQTPTSPLQTPQRTSDVERFEEYSENARMKKEEHDLRMKKLEEEIKSIVSQRTTAKTNGETSSVVVTEPLRDDKGKLIYDKDGKLVYKRIVGPKGQLQTLSGEDPEVRLLNKIERYKEIMKPELDEEKIKTIIKEALPAKEEKPITKEDLEKAATTAAQTVLATKEQEDKEERRHNELLQAVKEGSSSKVVEGYKSDSYRFMGQSLDHLAGVIEKKEPIKIVVDLLREAPPEKTVEKEAREGIFKRVHPKLVAEE